MRNLTETELLNLWESCIDKPLIETALYLLAAADDTDLKGVAALSIGQRDARLLQLREWMFGSRLKNTAECPQCLEKVEWENKVKDLHLQQILPETGKIFDANVEGYNISFRLPDSNDLIYLEKSSSPNPSDELLSHCVTAISSKDNEHIIIADLTVSIKEKINELMSKEDPQADIMIKITCPSCNYQWETGFDILSYIWTEINSWAKQILQEIFMLAKFFGWSEREVLEIGPKRRKLYLEMVRA